VDPCPGLSQKPKTYLVGAGGDGTSRCHAGIYPSVRGRREGKVFLQGVISNVKDESAEILQILQNNLATIAVLFSYLKARYGAKSRTLIISGAL
jgi:hypothetical protein